MTTWKIATNSEDFKFAKVYLDNCLLKLDFEKFELALNGGDIFVHPAIATINFCKQSTEMFDARSPKAFGHHIVFHSIEENNLNLEAKFLCHLARIDSLNTYKVFYLKHFNDHREYWNFLCDTQEGIKDLTYIHLHKWCNLNGWTDFQIVDQKYWAIAPNSFIPEPIPVNIKQIESECRAKVLASVN